MKFYRGKLTIEKAAEGIGKLKENSNNLLKEAELLFNNNMNQRAFTLAVLAVEENSKIHIIKAILLNDKPEQLRKLWKDFISHKEKNWPLTFLNLPENLVSSFKKLYEFLEDQESTSNNLESKKQLSIYVDLDKNMNWVTPHSIINKEIAEVAIINTRYILSDDNSGMTTLPELYLWVKHLKPLKNVNDNDFKTALIKCYQEAESLNVLTGSQTSNDIIHFFDKNILQ
jgi:AbiV family abortive infection protein